MEKTKTGQVFLYPPAQMWRILSEARDDISACMAALKRSRVRVSRRALTNWLMHSKENEMPKGWHKIEPVLAKLAGK